MHLFTEKSSIPYAFMALFSNIIFGLTPIFWYQLHSINSYAVLTQRTFWTALFLTPLVFCFTPLKTALKMLRENFFKLLLSGSFIGVNWLTYIYAIQHSHVIEASLAYFIGPLFAFFLAGLVLKEKISPLGKAAVCICCLSIVGLLIVKRTLPFLGLAIAGSFACYGLMGKKMTTKVSLRLWFETLFLCALLSCCYKSPPAIFAELSSKMPSTWIFFPLSGVITVIPFFLINTAIVKLPYSTVSMLCFLLPIFLFLTSVFYFSQTPDKGELVALIGIFVAVILYILSLTKKAPDTKPIDF